MSKKLIIIFILAFLIRLIALNQSLWLDEATTANVVKYNGYFGIIKNFSVNDFHPPIYYLFLKTWSAVFGISEISLRFPSLLLSFLTGWLIYLIGKKLHREEIGFWAAVFFLFNPLVVYYSQEARMYMMATFLTALTLYLFFVRLKKSQVQSSCLPACAGRRRQAKFKVPAFVKTSAFAGATTDKSAGKQNHNSKLKTDLLIFNIFIVLSFFTFYGSVFFIITVLLYLIFKKQYKMFFISFLFLILAFLINSPLLYSQFLNAKKQFLIVSNWSKVLGQANFKNLLLIPLKFSFGRISFHPKVIYYLISGLWTIFIFYYAFLGGFKNKRLFFFFTAPIILGLIFSFFTPLFSYFRFIYLLPVFCLLLSCGVKKRRLRLIIASGFVILSLIYLLNPVFYREDWKKLSQHLTTSERVYMIYSSSDPIKYYRQDVVVNDIKELNKISDKKVMVIPYSTEIYGINYQKILKDKKYKLKDKKTFRGLTIENWSLN